jgi:hypothetical protein
MRKTVIVILAFLALGVAAAMEASAAPPEHGWDHRCGSQARPGAGWYNVRAYNVGCRTARRVARRFTWGGHPDTGRWHCQYKQIATEIWQTNCTQAQAPAASAHPVRLRGVRRVVDLKTGPQNCR